MENEIFKFFISPDEETEETEEIKPEEEGEGENPNLGGEEEIE